MYIVVAGLDAGRQQINEWKTGSKAPSTAGSVAAWACRKQGAHDMQDPGTPLLHLALLNATKGCPRTSECPCKLSHSEHCGAKVE